MQKSIFIKKWLRSDNMTDNEIFDIWDSYKRILKIHKDNVGGTVERELVISQGVADGTYDLINRLKANEEKNENIIRLAEKTIEKQAVEIEKLKAENDDLFFKLNGVMWSVDKWLDGDELKQDEVNRAITMREKTLQITEKLQAEIERLKEIEYMYNDLCR